MNRLLPFPALASALLFVACTPVQGVKPLLYRASSADVIAAVAQFCPTLSPGPAYTNFRLTETKADSVLCTAKPLNTTGLLGSTDPVLLRVNVAQGSGSGVASVTGSENWGGAVITSQNALSAVFASLDQTFARLP